MKTGDLVKHKKYGWIGIIVGWIKRHPEWRTQPRVCWTSENNREEECNMQRMEVIG